MRKPVKFTVGILATTILIGILANACSTVGPPSATIEVQATQAQTVEPTPEPTTAPTPEPTPEPEPIQISGSGKSATDSIDVPFAVAVLSIRHVGESNFILYAWQGEVSELLVNEIGNYAGRRWLVAGKYIFDIDADGPWEIAISPMGAEESVVEDGFSGEGDDVSGIFMPLGTQAWEFSHGGESNFVIWVHCAGGTDLIVNEIGSFTGSGVVRFPEGPCFFDVTADGVFAIKPR